MNSTTRLFERLEQIPQDPNDPESLGDLVVCAFGAFERYYVCWKTRGGEYRQDGYDLPQSLHEWLFPTDGTTRDFASLQVVFGRGDEYFASDKNSKLECKEPEIKKPETPVGDSKDVEKPILRRSRTISFMRPTSDPVSRPTSIGSTETAITSTSTSDTSTRSRTSSVSSQPSLRSQRFSISRPTYDQTPDAISPVRESPIRDPQPTPTMSSTPSTLPPRPKMRPLSMSFNSNTFPKIVEGKALTRGKPMSPPEIMQARRDIEHCTCGCHDRPLPRPTYADASVQTDPEPALRTALRIDTTSDSSSLFSRGYDSALPDYDTPLSEILPGPGPAPVIMGRMMDYFSNPGYRLGDSLSSMYSYHPQQSVYQEEYAEYREDWGEGGCVGEQQAV